jgi:hypothetical protein
MSHNAQVLLPALRSDMQRVPLPADMDAQAPAASASSGPGGSSRSRGPAANGGIATAHDQQEHRQQTDCESGVLTENGESLCSMCRGVTYDLHNEAEMAATCRQTCFMRLAPE